MTDSLLAAGLELIGGTTNPEYRLAKDWTFGDGEPDTVTVSSLLLDGDVQSGDRTANRTISLPVQVYASSRTDLSTKIDTLRKAVNTSPWALQWTPDTGLPVIFDCYRAKVTRLRDLVKDQQLVADLTVECSAKPFGRSPTSQSITVAGQVQVDNFDTAPTGATLDTTNKYEGTGSAALTLTRTSFGAGYRYQAASTVVPSRTFTAKDLSSDASVSLRVRWVAPAGPGSDWVLTPILTLSSAAGSISILPDTSPVFVTGDTSWHLVTYSLTATPYQTTGTFAVNAVTGYSFNVYSDSVVRLSDIPTSPTTVNFDDLRALPASSAQTTTARGSVLVVPSVVGSARTPVSLAAVASMGALLAHRPPVDQDIDSQILTGVTVAASPSTPAASTVAQPNSRYNGTYSAVLGVSTVGAAGSNTVSVTITQLENGSSVATQTLTATYTSPQADRLVKMGEVTLPLRAIPADNSLTTYTFAFNHSAGADAYSDFMLLDTRGQTVIADPPSTVAAIYIDEPAILATIGNVYASASGRTMAYGIMDTALVTGGPFIFEPGDDRMLVWADTTSPTLTTTYYPRWLDERLV